MNVGGGRGVALRGVRVAQHDERDPGDEQDVRVREAALLMLDVFDRQWDGVVSWPCFELKSLV